MHAVAKLNSVANSHGTGRDDLDSEVLEAALQIQGEGAAAALARHLLEAFTSLRVQLRASSLQMDSLDPCLCRNEKLARALKDFEKSWERARHYLLKPALLHSLSSAVQILGVLQCRVPAFKRLCEQCDVELFLVLPRLLWLSFLATPVLGLLLGSVLPHHFRDGEVVSEQLQKLVAEHRGLVEQLGSSSYEQLIGHVIRKACSDVNADCSLEPLVLTLSTDVQGAVDGFLLKLEGWSMELQRHHAHDWNDLVALLLQCLGNV